MSRKSTGKRRKRQRRQRKDHARAFWIVIVIILVILLALLIVAVRHQRNLDEQERKADAEEQTTGAAIEFPYLTDKDRLEIASLFQYTGTNPDSSDAACEDVASLQVKNCSGQYLESADITVVLTDQTTFTFQVRDIPDGQSVWTFDAQNQSWDGSTGVKKITADTVYSDTASLREDTLSITGDETGIHVTNTGADTLTGLTVIYHCYLNEMYFGGVSYEGAIESLTPGEESVLETPECYFGEAAVVNIKN